MNIFADTIGTLTFNYGAASQQLTLTGAETESAIVASVRTALENLSGIGTGNVLVSGSRYAGYVIEFIVDLAGDDVARLTVTTTAAAASATVEQIRAAVTGINEIKRITIETTPAVPPTVTASVTEVSAASSGSSEVKALVFTTPYASHGTFDDQSMA